MHYKNTLRKEPVLNYLSCELAIHFVYLFFLIWFFIPLPPQKKHCSLNLESQILITKISLIKNYKFINKLSLLRNYIIFYLSSHIPAINFVLIFLSLINYLR